MYPIMSLLAASCLPGFTFFEHVIDCPCHKQASKQCLDFDAHPRSLKARVMASDGGRFSFVAHGALLAVQAVGLGVKA